MRFQLPRVGVLAPTFAIVISALTGGSAVASVDGATVTGGGTVLVGPTLASFGINARAPGIGQLGRIEYRRHAKLADAHVNAPVVFAFAATAVTPTPNGSGGVAILVGDCTAPGADCPPGALSVVVLVVDSADSGSGTDVFQISFCSGPPSLTATGCSAAEGGTLRTGNIQVR
jgi:hypothetical protein